MSIYVSQITGTIENDTAVDVCISKTILLVLPPCSQCIDDDVLHKVGIVMCRVLKRSQFGKVDWQE